MAQRKPSRSPRFPGGTWSSAAALTRRRSSAAKLPPRDTKKSEKLQKQEEEDIRHGRELRERHNRDANRKD